MAVSISASQVNELRKKTGAGMMDCKKALVEAEGDQAKAIELLRKKGQKVAAKREDREASEGVVVGVGTEDNKSGVIVAVNCETDFVAKNDDFIGLAKKILDIAVANKPADTAALKALPFADGLSIEEKITEQTGVIGEKIDLSAYKLVEGETVVVYNHPGYKLTAAVALNKAGENVIEAGKEVAMQVAAMNPLALNKDGVDQEVIAKEVEIGKEEAIKAGKPAELAEKIAQGKLGKFFKENTLLEQDYISNNKLSVQKYLDQVEGGLTVTAYERVSIGG
ncbi:translation elongation factor Ts [Luteibaculum oceani]|uniref:Elongation factor Ts n=1 Tax=Luteibaculum oceani TaxID=1294296 RepID=A0A5C6V288_9FLAO|nr:translation elongation factor Ts [Luteibaculum oceani]TXC78940.1 elongation factor Ts [Luteibaculum oceani]